MLLAILANAIASGAPPKVLYKRLETPPLGCYRQHNSFCKGKPQSQLKLAQ